MSLLKITTNCMTSKQIDDFVNYVISNSKIIYIEDAPDFEAIKFRILCIWFIDGDIRFYTGKTEEERKQFYKNIGVKLHSTLCEKFCVQKMVTYREIMQIPRVMYETYAKILVKDMENSLHEEINKFNKNLSATIDQ